MNYGENKAKLLPDHNNNFIKVQMAYAAKLLMECSKIKRTKDMTSLLKLENYNTILERN